MSMRALVQDVDQDYGFSVTYQDISIIKDDNDVNTYNGPFTIKLWFYVPDRAIELNLNSIESIDIVRRIVKIRDQIVVFQLEENLIARLVIEIEELTKYNLSRVNRLFPNHES